MEGLPVPILHLVRILGIFLDNAMEASAETEEKRLGIAILKKDGNTVMMIKNSTLPVSFALHELQRDGCTTKGQGHGTGLGNVEELVNKHSEITWTTRCERDVFTQMLEIEGEYK